MVYVTHDQLEALSMADRIAVMHDGVLQQFGTPQEIYDHPVNEWVAGFVGEPPMNFLDCRLEERDGQLHVVHPAFAVPLTPQHRAALPAGAIPREVRLAMRPAEIAIVEPGVDGGDQSQHSRDRTAGRRHAGRLCAGRQQGSGQDQPDFAGGRGEECWLPSTLADGICSRPIRAWPTFESGPAFGCRSRTTIEVWDRETDVQLSREDLLKAYHQMRTIRDFEERVHDEFSAGNIPGFVHLYAGEEASGVGFCMHLTDVDRIASTHRGHGHSIAKGCDTRGMMHEIFGRKEGLCGGKGGSMHIADLEKGMMGANGIVGGGPPLICGAALTAKTLKTGGVAIAFVGDGGSNQGTTFESYNLAKVWNLPAIFVVEDNGYAELTASAWSVGGSQLGRAEGFGMPAHEVDGNDFFAVYEVAREVIERARGGGGPSLVHVKLNRYFGHFEGDAMTYRGADEVAKLRATKDPLQIFRQRVVEAALLEPAELDQIDQEVKSHIDQVTVEAKAAPMPTEKDLLTDVYVTY